MHLVQKPLIKNKNVGMWNLLIEGATILTDMKHAEREDIPRLSIFKTTNINLAGCKYT
jgi:hypothetical protein